MDKYVELAQRAISKLKENPIEYNVRMWDLVDFLSISYYKGQKHGKIQLTIEDNEYKLTFGVSGSSPAISTNISELEYLHLRSAALELKDAYQDAYFDTLCNLFE